MHISIKSFLHLCPGLIHFIFVDRVRDRVIAPNISNLRSTGDDNIYGYGADNDPIIKFIKDRVWEMVHLAHEQQDRGYIEVGWRENSVQYWYKLWMEDEEGVELTGVALSERKRVARCFELYTMYLPFVSSQAIATYNRHLMAQLLIDRKN